MKTLIEISQTGIKGNITENQTKPNTIQVKKLKQDQVFQSEITQYKNGEYSKISLNDIRPNETRIFGILIDTENNTIRNLEFDLTTYYGPDFSNILGQMRLSHILCLY